jgi:hypothetical protein
VARVNGDGNNMPLRGVDDVTKDLPRLLIKEECGGTKSVQARENPSVLGRFGKSLGLYFHDPTHIRRGKIPDHIPLFFLLFLI